MTVRKSIVVPCYNEALNLPSLISRFAELYRPGDNWELVLVNNGSTDDSASALDREIKGKPYIVVATVPAPNVGYGHGILTGLRAARGEYLAWTHADGQTPPKDVLTAFDILESAKNPRRTFVKGRRRGRPAGDRLFTFGMETAAAIILGKRLPDINAQPKAFHRDLLGLAVFPPTDLSLDLYFFWLAKSNGFKVQTFDVSFGKREHGTSKWAFSLRSRKRHITRTLKFMVALRSRTGPRSSLCA
ncbi:MAG: glycosyltransferase family 2 protein [Candidatus Eisenbacteria bacterium]|nr:glycosyltransferase family 2 protein [Candidatus Eisenbacteria bacterium]